ncbi:phage tail protein [Vibrio minamisatsumaniensis]|uniref:phage tail protein n=1 Tax=Vibrio minamisatsumaniensis TaxID=2910243 RepID=UPI003D21787A
MSKFFTILTKVGEAKLANATALGQTVQFEKLAVGDGNGVLPTPDQNQTALINEVRREPLNAVEIDPNNPNWIICEQIIPENVGGWTIREVGIYDVDGDLIAVGNFPETYKPILEEGSGRTQTVRIVLQVSSSSSVELKIDPSIVLATREYVDKKDAELERKDNAATDQDIDSNSVELKHVKLPQLWRAFEKRNVVHEVTRNVNVLLPAGSPVQLTWNSVKHNPTNIFEPASNLFRAKKEGWYDVRGLVHYTPVSGSPTVYIHALVNGVLDGNSRSGAGGAGSGLNAIGVSAKVYLMVGDTLGLYLFTTGQINQNTFDDDDHNFFQLIYKGK